MKKKGKLLIAIALLGGTAFASVADKGSGKKKETVSNNIRLSKGFKANFGFNTANGLKYKGSFYTMANGPATRAANGNMVFEKGNSVYIIPSKPRVLVPEVKSGYNGMKLTFKIP